MPEHLKIALAQFAPKPGEILKNLKTALDFIAQAAEEEADLVLLPEMFLSGYCAPDIMSKLKETREGENLGRLSEVAASNRIAVAGSFLEWDPIKQSTFNTAVFVDDTGKLLEDYQKIHLFDQEKEYMLPGRRLPTFRYRGVDLGFLICFDLEFPEPARSLALQGMQVLLVPSANMAPYGPIHRNFALARAQENHIFVAYCNQTGVNGTCEFVGESCLVSPLGELICQVTREEKMVSGVIDTNDISRSQEAYNYLKERRCGCLEPII